MVQSEPLIKGTLIKRYKRFLADVRLDDGTVITAHTPNTGSMLGCCTPGSPVWLRDTGNPKRKYPLSWELVETATGTLVGINTGLANQLVQEAIESERIPGLDRYDEIQTEVRYGEENSRIDLLLRHKDLPDCFIEVKNVTLAEAETAMFPDAVTSRGSKHLRELQRVVAGGRRAIIFFCVQRDDAIRFQAAGHIDATYATALAQVTAAGVEVLAWKARVSPGEISLYAPLPVNG